MTFAFRLTVAAGLLCGALFAQDITGRWTGVADTTDEGNTRRQEQQTIEVKTVDGKLAAVSIGKDGQPGAAIQIQQDGAKFNLYRFRGASAVETRTQGRQTGRNVFSFARQPEEMGL